MKFPSDFLWGTATASYQVEGAANVDGRGPSVWDTFSHTPGRVAMDGNGDISCDQYHRYKDDVQLMKWLGVKAYRFSISWPRVFPEGAGRINEKGLDYYRRLADELLANGIQPWATLFHWDLPQAVEDKFGGWTSPETSRLFADYAACIARRLGDRIDHFFTINEFICFTDLAYISNVFAPGKSLPPARAAQIRHNGLLGHGLAVQALRANAPRPIQVGLAENALVCVPVLETEEHIRAARKAMRLVNAHYLTAVLEGAYPAEYLAEQGPNAPRFTPGEMKTIASPLDFVGLNMYAPTYVRAAGNERGYEIVPHPETAPRMHMPWLYLGPTIAYWGPRWAKEIWGVKSVVITENGCASEDKVAPDKEVYDTDRVMYLRSHLNEAARAVAEGWPLKGYFLWSLMDNFEWCMGYTRRFGIVYVNYATLERIPKLSAKFYRETIRNGVVV